MVSGDGRVLALYLPITSKEISYRIYNALRERIDAMTGDEQYFITQTCGDRIKFYPTGDPDACAGSESKPTGTKLTLRNP